MKNADYYSERLLEFRRQLALRDEKKRGYASAFDLSPKLKWSDWTRNCLREMPDPPGLPCPPEEVRDLTQLSDEMLGWLYAVCEKKLGEIRTNTALTSHVKRLRGAIRCYFELILQKDIPIPDQRVQGLVQEGPFCFFRLLRRWAQAAGKPGGEKNLIRLLLRFASDEDRTKFSLLQGTWEERFQLGVPLPDTDAQILQKCLFEVVQAFPTWEYGR